MPTEGTLQNPLVSHTERVGGVVPGNQPPVNPVSFPQGSVSVKHALNTATYTLSTDFTPIHDAKELAQ